MVEPGPPAPVRETDAMIRSMSPALQKGRWVFVTSDDPTLIDAALATMREPEGRSLLLPEAVAAAHGFDMRLPMAWITLQVTSALDGVGLTAAVAAALTEVGIPCNVIAGHHHDHLFVPAERADAALAALRARAAAP